MNKEQKTKREYFRAASKKFYQNIRIEAIKQYGGKCEDCGESNVKVLILDKSELKRKIPTHMQPSYWLKKNKWTKGIKVLCSNCKLKGREEPEGRTSE